MNLGSLEVLPIVDGIAKVSKHHAGFGKMTDEQWKPHEYLLEGDFFRLDIGGLLVGIGERTVLIDLGIAQYGPPPFNVGGEFLDSLRAQGFTPSDITDVLMTHLHVDHCGWASIDGAATFPNATYRCHAADWDHFTGETPHAVVAPILEPVRERVETWSADTTLFPGVDVVHAPGHTPGSSIVVLSSQGKRGLILGDVTHCPVQLLDEEWGVFYDVDPVLARQSRTAVMRELEDSESTVATSCHFPGMRFGRVVTTEVNRKWVVQ